MPIQQLDGSLTDGPVAPYAKDPVTDTLGELVFETRVMHETLRVWMANDAPSQMLDGNGRPVVLNDDGTIGVRPFPAPVVITVNPIIDTNALATGDLAAAVMYPLVGVSRGPGRTTVLQEMHVVDGSVQSVTLELWFFDTNAITLPSLNAAWAITDAHATHCVGVVQTGTYYASSNNSVSISKQIGLSMRTAAGSIQANTPSGVMAVPSDTLWFALIARGAPTYGAASDLQFTFTFYPDA